MTYVGSAFDMSRTPSSSRPPPTKISSTAEFNGKSAAARDDVIRTKILLLGMRRHVCSAVPVSLPAHTDRPGAERRPSARSSSTTSPRAKPSISRPPLTSPNNHSSAPSLPPPRLHLISHPPHSTIIPLEIWDCPGDVPLETIEAHLAEFAAMIFVIDIQVSLS